MTTEIELTQLKREKRTEEEIKIAHQSLSDAFYPRRVKYTWEQHDISCGECGEKEYHLLTCKCGVSRKFGGWQTIVSTYKYPGGKCDKDECYNYAIMRIRLNIWGCLYEFDVCEKHGKR